MDMPGVRPVVWSADPVCAHGVLPHIVPFLGVTRSRAQHMIEESMLPERRFAAEDPECRFRRPFLPPADEFAQGFGFVHGCDEEVNVIRHDHLATNAPAVAAFGGEPLGAESGGHRRFA